MNITKLVNPKKEHKATKNDMVKITISIPAKNLNKLWVLFDNMNQGIKPDTFGDKIISQLLEKIMKEIRLKK